jgi:DNA-directed RNA polymerase omega subunit
MIFYDLDKLFSRLPIENKYLLTRVLGQRARQLSESKGRNILEESGEKYISSAIRELAEGKLILIFPPEEGSEFRRADESPSI